MQAEIRRDIEDIKNQKVFVLGSSYKISLFDYNRILQNKITDKRDNSGPQALINSDTDTFAWEIHINNRIGKWMEKKTAYILFKDHKPNFQDKRPAR